MAEPLTYNIHVGKEIASLKPYENLKAPRVRMVKLEEGRLEAETEPATFDEVFVYVFCGALSGFLSWLIFEWERVPRWFWIGLMAVLIVAALVLIVYGLGLLTAGKGLRIGKTRVEIWSRFLWMTRIQTVQGRPKHIICTGTPDAGTRGRIVLNICLQLPPPHGLRAVVSRDGYSQVERDRAARCKPYEIVLDDIHREALNMAEKLGLKLRPNFSKGPIPDQLKKLFEDEDLTEPLDLDEQEDGEEDETDDRDE